MDLSLLSQLAEEVVNFHAFDLLTVGTLAMLEGILSVDNALVLAILVRNLPRQQQKRALTYGIVGAFAFRFVALVFAAHLMRFGFFKLIGGGYLVYLAMKHMFFKEDAHQMREKPAAGFWRTVLMVELTDIAFSIDSITTAVAMTDKLLVVWVGGILGIIFLRFAASFFVRLLERLPRLEDPAYQLIFFIGTKLFLDGFRVEISHGIFWMMMGIIAVLGASLVYRDYYQRRTRSRYQNQLLEKLQRGAMSADEALGLDPVPGEIITWLRANGQLEVRSSSTSP
jgi:YkoY family integral membrane protein